VPAVEADVTWKFLGRIIPAEGGRGELPQLPVTHMSAHRLPISCNITSLQPFKSFCGKRINGNTEYAVNSVAESRGIWGALGLLSQAHHLEESQKEFHSLLICHRQSTH